MSTGTEKGQAFGADDIKYIIISDENEINGMVR